MKNKNEIIKKFKAVNKDVRVFTKKKRELDKKYGYLNRISPMPEERLLPDNTYFRFQDELIIPERIDMNYGKTETKIVCKYFKIHENKFTTTHLKLTEFKRYVQITEEEALEMIKRGRESIISEFNIGFSVYMKELYKKDKI